MEARHDIPVMDGHGHIYTGLKKRNHPAFEFSI
jgi:hypothetical protein